MGIEQAKYTIVSVPKSIKFICPYCKKEIEVDVNHLDFYHVSLWDGGIIECSECHKDIELTDWEYD